MQGILQFNGNPGVIHPRSRNTTHLIAAVDAVLRPYYEAVGKPLPVGQDLVLEPHRRYTKLSGAQCTPAGIYNTGKMKSCKKRKVCPSCRVRLVKKLLDTLPQTNLHGLYRRWCFPENTPIPAILKKVSNSIKDICRRINSCEYTRISSLNVEMDDRGMFWYTVRAGLISSCVLPNTYTWEQDEVNIKFLSRVLWYPQDILQKESMFWEVNGSKMKSITKNRKILQSIDM